jgi:peptidoglycan/xylan/chitin deacetylase (PgdA/CDA1 family)
VSEPTWPNGARGALSLSFDNLGEAAEIELGAIGPGAELGEHFTATRVLPSLLDALGDRDLCATFFVEGLNAEIYPEQLKEIAGRGHEVGYHAWRHEQWDGLSATERADNLARGLAAFGEHGLGCTGLRPPGGGLGPEGTKLLREAGLRYCSPAGEGVGVRDGVVLVPFQWRHVDASCVLPPLAPVRKRMTGSADPLGPDAYLAYLEAELERLCNQGGYMTFVFHLFMLDWLGWERLAALLDRVAGAERRGDLWLAPCADIATQVLAEPERFGDETVLDPTSWADAGN